MYIFSAKDSTTKIRISILLTMRLKLEYSVLYMNILLLTDWMPVNAKKSKNIGKSY